MWNAMENTEENCEKIRKKWKKSKSNSEMIWKICKKSKVNSGMIWKIWKIYVLVIITPKRDLNLPHLLLLRLPLPLSSSTTSSSSLYTCIYIVFQNWEESSWNSFFARDYASRDQIYHFIHLALRNTTVRTRTPLESYTTTSNISENNKLLCNYWRY